MAKENKTDRKIVIEREYIVPLRSEWLKVPKYKRAKKALRALKEFMVQHMQIYDRDIRKIKVDVYLNNEIKFRGNRKPAHKIKVKAIKYDNGIVEVKLVNLPKHIEFEIARNAKKTVEIAKNVDKAENRKETEVPLTSQPSSNKEEAKSETKVEEKGKEQESKEAEQQMDKAKVKEMKHSTGSKKEPEIKRKVLNR